MQATARSAPDSCCHRLERGDADHRNAAAKSDALGEAASNAQAGEGAGAGTESNRIEPAFAQKLLQHRQGELGVAVAGAALERRRSRRGPRARPSTTRWRFRSPRIACAILYTAAIMKEHSIAVIPGDGIGREVIPEGVRVLEAVGAKHGLRFKWQEFPLELRLVQGARQDVPGRRARHPAQVRRDLLRRGRQPGDRARPHLGVGTADQLPPLVRPLRQPAPGAPVRRPALPARRPQARRHRLHRDPREHRGRVRQRRRARL